MSNAFISFELDHTTTRLNLKALEGDVDETRKIAQQLDHANGIWHDFALNSGGTIIFLAGPEGKISVPADKLEDLANVVRQYGLATEDTVSVGVGMDLQQSIKALLAAKLVGGDQTLMYGDEVEKIIVQHKDGNLNKSELEMSTSPGVLDRFHSMAQAYEQSSAEKQQEVVRQQQLQALKAQIVEVLQQLKAAAPQLAELKTAAPETYQSISMMAQAMLSLAQEVTGVPIASATAQQSQQQTTASSQSSGGVHVPTYQAPKVPHVVIPVGSIRDGKIKVKVGDRVGWRSVRAGLGVDADGNPTSIRNLNSDS